MNMQPTTVVQPLWFGTGVHLGLAAYYDPDSPRLRVEALKTSDQYCSDWLRNKENPSVEDEEMINELRGLGIAVLDNYFNYVESDEKNSDKDLGIEVIWVERAFDVEIKGLPGVRYNFRTDGLVKDKYDRIWLLEHKTAAALPEGDQEWLMMDDQVGSYIWALMQVEEVKDVLAQHGKDSIEGVFYNSLRKKAPKPLNVLKNGELSTNKMQDTTFDIALRQLREEYGYGKVPMRYHAFLHYLKNKPNNFIKREFVRRNKHEIAMIGESMRWEVVEMVNNPYIYRSPSRINCSGCPFVGPCLVKWEGGDWLGVLNANYQIRGEH